MTTCLETALRCNALGLIPVLIHAGQKRPIGEAWQDRRYSDEELEERFSNSPNMNTGLLLGPVSGAVDIECDSPESPRDLAELFDGQIPTTPGWKARRGEHYLFAWDDRLSKIGMATMKCKSVEVRLGTGGKAAQSLLPPSTTDGFVRQWTTDLSTRPAKLPETVLEKLLTRVEPEKPKAEPKPKAPVDEDFCRTSRFEFLADYGWTGSGEHWTRPGTDKAVSASIVTAEDGTRLLHVFTTNGRPFEADTNYNAFDAYALLKHDGNRETARADLLKQGFGRLWIKLITCAELDSTDYQLDYLIPGVFVAKQPCLVGGPKKALKTSIVIDLAISLATGKQFLGQLPAKRPCKVIVLSGESGMGTLQETARRIGRAKDVRLPAVTNLYWSDFLPQLDSPRHLDAMERSIQETGCEVLVVDPLYLCLEGADAGNLFVQGALLRRVTDNCQRTGVAPVLCHHTRKRGKTKNRSDYEPPELDDLSWAGFAEFARQWLLLGRREDFVPGSGEHKLWLSVGGSAGHSGLWALDVEEGVSGLPRRWQVELSTPEEAREEKRADTTRQRILAAAKEYPSGETKTVIFDTAGLKSTLATRDVFDALVNDKLLLPRKIKKNGQTQDGYCLAS